MGVAAEKHRHRQTNRSADMQAAASVKASAGGGGGIAGGKAGVNRSLFPYAAAEGSGNGHAYSPALQVQAPSSPRPGGSVQWEVQAPSSPRPGASVQWDVGEGCDARSVLKENLAARYRGPRAPGNAHRRAVSASLSFAESDPRWETDNGGSGAAAGHETPGPSQKKRGSGEWHSFSAGAGLGQGEVDLCQPVGTPSGLRNGVLLQHRFCPWDGTEFRPLCSTCPVCGASRTSSRYSGSNDTVLALLLKPPWERVLWKKQPYDDNYVDRTFLESLVTNDNFYTYDVWQITKDSIVITQHLSGTAVFLAFTYMTNYQALDLVYMLALDILLALGGHIYIHTSTYIYVIHARAHTHTYSHKYTHTYIHMLSYI